VSAGPLVISTPRVEQSVLDPIRSRGMNLYERRALGDGDPSLLRAGDPIQIRAEGDLVPAFDTRVVFPQSGEIDFQQRPQGAAVSKSALRSSFECPSDDAGVSAPETSRSTSSPKALDNDRYPVGI
jgi:hypothetical protein